MGCGSSEDLGRPKLLKPHKGLEKKSKSKNQFKQQQENNLIMHQIQKITYQTKDLEDRKKKYQKESYIAKEKGNNCRESNPKQAQKQFKQVANINKTINKFDKRINQLKNQRRRLEEHNMNTHVIDQLEEGNELMDDAEQQRQKLQDIKLLQADIKRQHQQISEMFESSEDESVDKQVQQMMNQNKNRIQKQKKKLKIKNLNNGTDKPQNIDDILNGLN